ncbi:ABC transporter substrate-binding protein [Stratiformator vulcanicus]|uniref:NMT1/THI5 like protein n=1 Tax=Stratiformator vulcanicus TaxID=2527980 RepID=A0A517QXG6_9PLAN|nr:ABC transporter substrate-binding protein [Stratiformator vulcanicus]QDT36270.1 NMT1/THI5 like protein [Stratiformator vulcanicus]
MKRSLILIALLGIALGGCAPRDTPQSDGAEKTTSLTLQLNWYPEAEHGGYYAADVEGYYKEAGLDVQILPGGSGVPVVQKVAAGQADFGVANADRVLLLRAQEADVIAIMAPLQDSPRCLMVRSDAEVESFSDLAGYTIAMGSEPYSDFLRNGVLPADVSIVPYNGGVTQFVARNKNFAQQGYSFSEPYFAQQEGVEPKLLMVSETGFNPYTSCLIVSRAFAEENPDVVRNMVAASIDGWQAYLKSPEETNQLILQENSELTPEILRFGVNAMKPLCVPEGSKKSDFGTMDAGRWANLREQMTQSGSLDSNSDELGAGFSLEFLPNTRPGD